MMSINSPLNEHKEYKYESTINIQYECVASQHSA